MEWLSWFEQHIDFVILDLQIENVAIANALQLEAARTTPVLFRFNYDAIANLKSPNLPIAVL